MYMTSLKGSLPVIFKIRLKWFSLVIMGHFMGRAVVCSIKSSLNQESEYPLEFILKTGIKI